MDDNGRALISALVEEGVDADLQEFGESFMDLPESPDERTSVMPQSSK